MAFGHDGGVVGWPAVLILSVTASPRRLPLRTKGRRFGRFAARAAIKAAPTDPPRDFS